MAPQALRAAASGEPAGRHAGIRPPACRRPCRGPAGAAGRRLFPAGCDIRVTHAYYAHARGGVASPSWGRATVNMEISELGDKKVKIILKGRLDTPGVGRIETGFVAALVPKGRSAIVDLSQVDFVASLGLRMFLSTARGLGMRQAKIVLFAPQEPVKEV